MKSIEPMLGASGVLQVQPVTIDVKIALDVEGFRESVWACIEAAELGCTDLGWSMWSFAVHTGFVDRVQAVADDLKPGMPCVLVVVDAVDGRDARSALVCVRTDVDTGAALPQFFPLPPEGTPPR